jgi:hypothetical protein
MHNRPKLQLAAADEQIRCNVAIVALALDRHTTGQNHVVAPTAASKNVGLLRREFVWLKVP